MTCDICNKKFKPGEIMKPIKGTIFDPPMVVHPKCLKEKK